MIVLIQSQYHGYSTPSKISFILDRNLAKANCTGNRICTSCDIVVLGEHITTLCTIASRINGTPKSVRLSETLQLTASLCYQYMADCEMTDYWSVTDWEACLVCSVTYYYVFHGRVTLFFANNSLMQCQIIMKFLPNLF